MFDRTAVVVVVTINSDLAIVDLAYPVKGTVYQLHANLSFP